MTKQRIIFAIILAMQAGCVAAVTQNVFPKWTAFLLLGGTVVQAFMASIMAPADPALAKKKP